MTDPADDPAMGTPDAARPDRAHLADDDPPVVRLVPYAEVWTDDDPFADLKADLAVYAHVDPLTTLRGLSEASGVEVGALVRYVLARWAAGGSEGLLELGTSGVDHLHRAIEDAEVAGDDAARLAAYHRMRQVVAWLRAGDAPPGGDAAPEGDAPPDDHTDDTES